MNITAQQTEFLSWKVVPARLDATQAAWFLGFEPHEIPRLVTAGLLKPLGHPDRNSTKFFATETDLSSKTWTGKAECLVNV